jgi:DNA-binding response OmpR family regulator
MSGDSAHKKAKVDQEITKDKVVTLASLMNIKDQEAEVAEDKRKLEEAEQEEMRFAAANPRVRATRSSLSERVYAYEIEHDLPLFSSHLIDCGSGVVIIARGDFT